MRAPRDGLMDRGSWQFFAGLGRGGGPLWSADPGGLRPVLNSAAGVGWTVSAIYDRALGRYLLATEYGRSFAGRIALYEAAHPWGPWDLAARLRIRDPGGRAGTRTFYLNILPNTLSADGTRLTLAFTGTGSGDALNLVDGRLVLGGAPAPQGGAPAALRRALLKASARRGAAVVADALRQARQMRAGTGLDAAAPGFGLDDPAGGERLGLAVFPVGPAAPLDVPASAADPARAGFERAYGLDAGGSPGGVGAEYGLPGGTRLGVVLTSYGDAAGGGAGLASQEGMTAYLRQRLGALELDTSLGYSRDGHQADGYRGRASFAGRTVGVAQRVGLPLRAGGGLTVTPWAGLAYVSQAAAGFSLGDPSFGEQRYGGVSVGDATASLGLDGELAPVRLGEGAWLSLRGGLSYTQGLARDDYRVRVAALGVGQQETVARPATRALGLSLDGSLALGAALALDAGLSLEEDLATGPAGVGQVTLSYRF
jgi:hypothetical protein